MLIIFIPRTRTSFDLVALVLRFADTSFQWSTTTSKIRHPIVVVEEIAFTLLIGMDVLRPHKVAINMRANTVRHPANV